MGRSGNRLNAQYYVGALLGYACTTSIFHDLQGPTSANQCPNFPIGTYERRSSVQRGRNASEDRVVALSSPGICVRKK